MTGAGDGPIDGGTSRPRKPSATGGAPHWASPVDAPADCLSERRLHHLASLLGVPVASFFREATDVLATGQRGGPARAEEAIRLLNGFDRITDPFLRRSVLELVEGLADGRNGA